MSLLLLVFLAVSLGLAAVYQALAGFVFPDAARVSQRMADEFSKESQAPQSLLFKNLDRLDLRHEAEFPDAAGAPIPRVQQQRGLQARVQQLLEGADVPLTPEQVWLCAAGIGVVLAVAGFFGAGLWLAVPAAGLGVAAPFLVLNWQKQTRRQKYLKQLPGAFELMARVTRAGQSVPQAFQAVADAMEDPVAAEFASCQKQQNLGLRPELVFQEMAQRSGILEMRIFTMAMLIQRQTGGNLSDVLDRLAGLVRSRLRLRDRIRILTAEGRMQGWTLVVLPFVAFGAMMVMNREYAEVLLDHVALLVGTGVLMGIGILWIRKIVNFEP